MGNPTRGSYITRGRGLELEQRIDAVSRELGERVAAAEARAEAAEKRSAMIFDALVAAAVTTKRKDGSDGDDS